MSTTATAVIPTPCANWKDGDSICPNEGTLACKGCMLVLYCSRDCQVKHWTEHKKACKSPLSKSSWLPAWDRELRDPAWSFGAAATNLHNAFGPNKHFWGNTPAMDVLQLPQNEGPAYDKDVAILFAASGDVRNVVKTIQNLPLDFKHQVKMTINDRAFDVTARNAVILLLALRSLEESDEPDIEKLAETLIHIWYSANITKEMLSELQVKVKPLIIDLVQKTPGGDQAAFIRTAWSFKSGNSLSLTLGRNNWARVLEFLDVPEGLTLEKAREIRHAVTLAPERLDYRERWYFKDVSPSMRVAKQRYREDGLLLPFGQPRIGFDYPNPTIFQAADFWPLDDKADPLNGWPLREVRATPPSRATEDMYGRLLSYLRGVFSAFLRRLTIGKVRFEFFNLDARDLGNILDMNSYDRIEASNISDYAWLGTRGTLQCLLPLLKPPTANPHATLITVYLNAVMEAVKRGGPESDELDMAQIRKYLTKIKDLSLLSKPQGAEMYRIWDARNFVLDADKYFRKYMAVVRFEDIKKDLRVEMKEENTIGDAWPTALKLRPGQPGAQEEFDDALASCCSGVERFVEWKRVV